MASVLIIEDSQFTRRMIVRIVTAAGHEVLEACGGWDGVQKAKKHKPDCILLDLLMPEMDGFGVLEAFGREGIAIPVIVLSADIQETSRTKCFELGAVDFVKKPPKEGKVLEAVQKALNLKVGSRV